MKRMQPVVVLCLLVRTRGDGLMFKEGWIRLQMKYQRLSQYSKALKTTKCAPERPHRFSHPWDWQRDGANTWVITPPWKGLARRSERDTRKWWCRGDQKIALLGPPAPGAGSCYGQSSTWQVPAGHGPWGRSSYSSRTQLVSCSLGCAEISL